jgi:two-component system NtrC family response regulator
MLDTSAQRLEALPESASRIALAPAARRFELAQILATPSAAHLRRNVDAALQGSAPVLVLGESGTGKTVLAHAIAEATGRTPIVRAMLGGSDDLNTIVSELFGHERGAFSGATSRRAGLVELANRGTLVLDELLNLPHHAQKLLLDFTQFGTYRPLGYERATPKVADARIISATNGDLGAAIREGRFREDLYYRLAGVVLEVPPLRRRRDDIPVLAAASIRRQDHSRAWTLSPALVRALSSPSVAWPGNLRQLDQVLARARCRAVAADPCATTLHVEHIDGADLEGGPRAEGAPAVDAAPGAPSVDAWQRLQDERRAIEARESAMIRAALAAAGGVVARAARTLGLARTTLASRIEQLGIRSERSAS